MPLIQLTLDDKDIAQAIKDYIYKLGYTCKTPITIKSDVTATVTVEKTQVYTGSYDK